MAFDFDWRRFAPPNLPGPLPTELQGPQGPPISMAQMNQAPPGGVPSFTRFDRLPGVMPIGSPGTQMPRAPAIMPDGKPYAEPGAATPAVTGTATVPSTPDTTFRPSTVGIHAWGSSRTRTSRGRLPPWRGAWAVAVAVALLRAVVASARRPYAVRAARHIALTRRRSRC
jgi:hypothetical protein